mmetsp:Transcript_23087/g.54855  ORF Transcript_23087/g.54855 Transcript_23087/m.54855 type:complete len:394 (-) Transcript_23087:1284-2465(-)
MEPAAQTGLLTGSMRKLVQEPFLTAGALKPGLRLLLRHCNDILRRQSAQVFRAPTLAANDSPCHGTLEGLDDVSNSAAVAVVPGWVAVGICNVVATAAGEGDEVHELSADLRRHGKTLRRKDKVANLAKLVAAVILEAEAEGNAGLEARIRIEEGVHLRLIAGEDDNDVLALVFHLLDQRVHRFLAKGVLALAHQCVCLVDEENTTQCVFHGIFDLRSSLAKVLGDQVGTTGLAEHKFGGNFVAGFLASVLGLCLQLLLLLLWHLHHTHLHHHLSHDAGNHSLPGARIPQETHVEGLTFQGSHPEAGSPTAELHEAEQLPHGLLHGVEAHQFPEFGQQGLELFRIFHERQAVIFRSRRWIRHSLESLEAAGAFAVGDVVHQDFPVPLRDCLQS